MLFRPEYGRVIVADVTQPLHVWDENDDAYNFDASDVTTNVASAEHQSPQIFQEAPMRGSFGLNLIFRGGASLETGNHWSCAAPFQWPVDPNGTPAVILYSMRAAQGDPQPFLMRLEGAISQSHVAVVNEGDDPLYLPALSGTLIHDVENGEDIVDNSVWCMGMAFHNISGSAVGFGRQHCTIQGICYHQDVPVYDVFR